MCSIVVGMALLGDFTFKRWASTLYTITATNAMGQTATATVNLTTLLIVPAPATLTAVATGTPNEIRKDNNVNI
jgi:hypothetical protein